MKFKRINLIGVELEGGWESRPNHVNFKGDGSVDVFGSDECECMLECSGDNGHDCSDSCAHCQSNCDCSSDFESCEKTHCTCDDEENCTCDRDCDCDDLPLVCEDNHECYRTCVHCQGECNCDIDHYDCGDNGDGIDGELPTPPLDWKDIPKFIWKYHPDKVNGTCGMHVHISFKNLQDYEAILHSNLVHNYVLDGLLEWGNKTLVSKDHQLFKRLAGENTYCKPYFEPQSTFGGDRYRAFNFSSWGAHRTLEIRVLPAFHMKKISILAIKRLCELVEEALELAPPFLADISFSEQMEDFLLDTEEFVEVENSYVPKLAPDELEDLFSYYRRGRRSDVIQEGE